MSDDLLDRTAQQVHKLRLQSSLHCTTVYSGNNHEGFSIMMMSRLILGSIAAALAFSPIAAQANTRAADNSVVYTAPASQPGIGRPAEGEQVIGGGFLAAILAAIAAAGAIVIIDDDDDQSPGT